MLLLREGQVSYQLEFDTQGRATSATGYFTEAMEVDVIVYELPTHANLFIASEPDTDTFRIVPGNPERKVIARLQTDSAILQIHRDDETEHNLVDFPPTGPHFFYSDGSTEPANLRELIDDRLHEGWIASPELLELLKNNEPVAG